MYLSLVSRWSVLAVLASSSWGSVAQAADEAGVAGVRKYVNPEGIATQAVLLKARDGVGEVAHRHVILVDTSASQVGEHRKLALGILNSLLANLPAGDRVRLVAVDVATEPLTSEFVAPQGEAIQQATDELQARIPLGATNLTGAVEAARDMLPEDQPGSVIYIGDGVNTADVVNAKGLETLVGQLRSRKIAVHSYGVGPQLNLHLLGMFAQQTGGAVQFDSGVDQPRQKVDQNWSERGRTLAQAVSRPIDRPSQMTAPAGVALLPQTALPLRADRETIYLVRGELPAEAMLAAHGDKADQSWKLAAPITGPHEAFLAAMAERVEREGELANSLAGVQLLNVAQGEFIGQVTGLVNYGKLAFQRQDLDRVQQVVDAVRHLDPANRDLAAVEKGARKLQARQVALTQNETEDAAPGEEPAGEPAADDVGGDLEPRTQPNPQSSLLADEQRAIKIRTQKLRQQVNDVINIIRRLDDPQQGLDEIDRMLSTIRSSIDIEPETRLALEKQLKSERLAQVNRQQVQQAAQIRSQERRAQRESQERLAERLALEEERMANLIDRVRALMQEGRHGDDEAYVEAEVVARVAVNVRPGDGTAAAAVFGSEAATQLNRSFRLREKRADQFLEALHQVELAHIAFPDEPPIRFPPAAVWAALTERRRKWANVDLKRNSPIETRIQNALNETTEVSFIDTSLRDALDYIEDLHNFDIIINEKEISEDGGSADVQINLELSGVMLRSALKLMLEQHDLTYVIQDEVMQITTVTAAEGKLMTRVYPVADLVIPIRSLGGGMGGMGGGGMMGGMMTGGMGGGGMGGGMGGMGGGMGGMGGMGGGGFGGGFFSVPAEKVPAPLKKKR